MILRQNFTCSKAIHIIENMSKKIRLDKALLEKGLAKEEHEATGLILSGKVKVNDQVCDKPGTQVSLDANISTGEQKKYVSRGGLKLEAALKAFEINPRDKICADAGCSTGGFTDVLLKSDATKVYAIDTAYGELDWSLREDSRVVVMERTNVTQLNSLPEAVDLVTIDLSLLSSKLILPVVRDWIKESGDIVLLLKPQYELDSDKVPTGGVIKDTNVHKKILENTLSWCLENNLYPRGLIKSPIKGGEGNTEFLVHIKISGEAQDTNTLISEVLSNV